jgi:hypothetical protein
MLSNEAVLRQGPLGFFLVHLCIAFS